MTQYKSGQPNGNVMAFDDEIILEKFIKNLPFKNFRVEPVPKNEERFKQ